jgi:DNA-binding transcriptional LysR family regulator
MPRRVVEGEPFMDLDLGLVASFTTLVDEEHFGRAARRLHLTSSALTKRIQRLERQVGVALVERGSGGVLAVTAAGRRFADAASPLLACAAVACETARAGPGHRSVVRLGIPAGTGTFLRQIDVGGLARTVRRDFPGVRLVCLDVPFPALTRCLPEHGVDVLWTNAPVRHPQVESFPVPVTSTRVGVVGARHPLADAGAVDVGELGGFPILYNPAVPAEFMDFFWLGDLRPRRDARLVEADAREQSAVFGRAVDGTAVVVTYPVCMSASGPPLNVVDLTGTDPVGFCVARRRTDRTGPVHALVEALQGLAPRQLVRVLGPSVKSGSG